METLLDQRCKSQSLSSTPVNTLTFLDRLLTSLIDSLDSRVECPVIRECGDFKAELSQFVRLDSCFAAKFACVLDALPLLVCPLFDFEFVALASLVGSLEFLSDSALQLLRLFLSENSFRDKLSLVLLSNRLHLRDTLVHQGLSEGRLIELIVTMSSVADEINHDVVLEALAVLSCN